MNNIANYISAHFDIKTVCIAPGSDKDAMTDAVKKISSGIRFVCAEESSLADALIFDESSDSVKELSDIKASYIIGECRGEGAFEIWEAFRETAKHIYIVTHHEDAHDEVLEWDRREDNDIELSVIYPMYNVEKYLPQCIETTTAWDAPYVEFLFVDDGSPDNSGQVIEQAAAKDARIKLLRKENGGCASARQFGLERARGRYIGFIDPDDYTDRDMFKKLFARALTGSYEISYSGYNEHYEVTGETTSVSDPLGRPYSDGTCDRNEIDRLLVTKRVAIWRGIYLKDILDRNGLHFYTDLRRFDDLPFSFEVFSCAKSVVTVPEHLYYYRMARPGQDVAADDERLYVHFDIFNYLDEFASHCTDYMQKVYLQLVKVQTHSWALEKLRDEFVEEYVSKAREDLLKNYSYKEGRKIIRTYGSKTDYLLFMAICRKAMFEVKIFRNHRRKKSRS